MKKAIRIIALFAALMLLCLSATSCDAIDDMRAHHGFYTETGSIMLGEDEYLLLPDNQYFAPLNDSDESVYVTDSDVPVLLSFMLGVGFNQYNDGLILSTSTYGETRNYCRKDRYEEIAAQMASEFNPTAHCYTYSVLDTETEMYKERQYRLTKEQEDAVNDVLNTVERITRAENAHYTSDYHISLHACTDNMLLQDWVCDIEKNNNTYYIVMYDPAADADVEYTVPAACNATFDAIFKSMIDAEKAEREYYSDRYGYNYEEEEYKGFDDGDYENV